MANIEHSTLTGAAVHEPKGIESAATGDVYLADGTGGGEWTSTEESAGMGFWDYNDLATTTTPISLTSGVATALTNDGLGTFTNKTFRLSSVVDIWDSSTNQFDFTDLVSGDTVDMRLDVTVTTTGANHNIAIDLELGLGGFPYTLRIDDHDFKTAGTYQLTAWYGIYVGDANTKDNGGRFALTADSAGDSVVVNGWYIRAVTRGVR